MTVCTGVSIDDIREAEERLDGRVVRTPLIESRLLNDRIQSRVLFKTECLQKTGSFKIRGALNKLSLLTEHERAAGVVAYSSGNHAQGVAAAANALQIHAKIVIPDDAPRLKIDNTRAWGADVILYDRHTEDRAQIARDIADRERRILVPPYDDPHIIAGQGTVGLEISQALTESELEPDVILCPCGGGGLIAGTAIAIKEQFPKCQIFSVEPQNFEDTQRSLKAGIRVSNAPGHTSICDAIVTERPGELTFPINQAVLTAGIAVSEEMILEAMRTAFQDLKLVLEPGGAVGLAALLSNSANLTNRTVVVVLSGGNIDLSSFINLLNSNDR